MVPATNGSFVTRGAQVTTRPITAGEQLLVNYGESYWQRHGAAQLQTATDSDGLDP